MTSAISVPYIANTVLMIEPAFFGYNTQTAANNYFQQNDDNDLFQIQQQALIEFRNMVTTLRNAGVRVIVVKDTPYPRTPDAVFPNNWISFHLNNHVIFYPMYAENRRLERRMDILIEIENQLGKKFDYTDYSNFEQKNYFLEGTGSIVPDRKNRIAYACISPRTNKELFVKFCREIDFKPVYFYAYQTVGKESLPIYHTNVMMCMGNKYAVVALEAISNRNERKKIEDELTDSGKEIVEISASQMNRFCGNMLLLKSGSDEKVLVMSQSAYSAFDETQISTLTKYNKPVVIPVPTIEKYGGGSVRCMMAEIF